MSATFVTDIATVAGLTILFIKPTIWIVPFVAASAALIIGLPRTAPWFFGRYGDRVIEPEIKLVFACLFGLMWLGSRANSQAALPAFILGLVMSGHYVQHRREQERMRVVAFAFLTPFFFLKGGMNVSASALWANLGILALLFAGKMVPKLLAVYPLARRYTAPHAVFTTLLMSTGLTFGTITSLYGLNAGIIDRTQFLTTDLGRRAVGDRADRDRAALLLAVVGRAPGHHRSRSARGARRGRSLIGLGGRLALDGRNRVLRLGDTRNRGAGDVRRRDSRANLVRALNGVGDAEAVHRALELPDPVAERPADLRQPLGAEEQQREDAEEEQMYRREQLDSHRPEWYASVGSPWCASRESRASSTCAIRTGIRFGSAAGSRRGRKMG